MLIFWLGLLYSGFCLFFLWVFARLFLSGTDLRRYDTPAWGLAAERARASPENTEVLRLIRKMRREIEAASLLSRLRTTRRVIDQGIAGTSLTPGSLGVERRYIDAAGVAAEWILAPDGDPDRRLLYVHGGAFTVGSPTSHRNITAALARLTGVSVLAIDYRLMPEHPRRAGVDDCRVAYRWLLENGPDQRSSPRSVYVAGDSAGGNLVLMLIAWIRDCGLRPPDAAIALSPATDSTLSSPSLRANISTDPFLGPTMGRLARLPRTVVAYMTLLSTHVRPQDPTISPLRGDLSGLPPTLIQASANEMLVDDATRYVNKARSVGSPAELQLWPEMVHVWQLFDPVLPEAHEALEKIAAFIRLHPGTGGDDPQQ